MTSHTTLRFRDLVAAACKQKGLSQHQLAYHASVSQTSISLIGSHQRSLSANMANEFARILGGTSEFWLNAYTAYVDGTPAQIEDYLKELGGGLGIGQEYGVGKKTLLNFDILRLFWLERLESDCRIKGFDPRRIAYSSYYTRLGYVEQEGIDPTIPVREAFPIEPGQEFKVRTLEQFVFPLWLEADFQAASQISNAGLSVDSGPTIDPGYDGHLKVSIKNLTKNTVNFYPNWHFLKLRFSVFETAAKPMSEITAAIGPNIEDEHIYADAIAEEL